MRILNDLYVKILNFSFSSLTCKIVNQSSIRVEKEEGLFEIGKKTEKVKEQVVNNLRELARPKENQDTKEKLQMLFNLFNTNVNFDFSIIQMLRIMTANYLRIYKDKEVNGISLDTFTRLHEISLEEFITKIVLEPYKEVESLIYYIVPLVLRINITTLVFNPSSEIPVHFM